MKKLYALGILIVFVTVMLFTHKADAALTRVQAFSGTNTTFASSVTTSSVTVTAGNLIICGAEADVVATNGITITDSKGNSWTRNASNSVAATFDMEIWSSVITTGGAGYTVTANDTGGGVDSLIICEEWSGNAASPFDVKSTGTDGSGASVNLASGSTGTTGQANELVVGAGVASGVVTLTTGAGYSNKTQVNSPFSTLGFETKTVSSTGTQSATFTSSAGASWVMGVSTYKELASTATEQWPQLIVGNSTQLIIDNTTQLIVPSK